MIVKRPTSIHGAASTPEANRSLTGHAGLLAMRRATNASLTAKFIGVVVTALVVGTAASLAVVLLLMVVAPWAAR